MTKDKYNDVESLADQLHLGSVHYREFNKPTPLKRKVEAVPPAADRAAAAPQAIDASPAVATPPRSQRPTVTAVKAETRPAGVVENPVAFTFERLRRQAIASPMRGPALHLNLPERRPHREQVVAERFRSQPLEAVFRRLENVRSGAETAGQTGT